ncbi:hypothetical protein AMS68_004389 [Peltaster fructicola]|uniref:Survival protein SurE-like phosphatase/nucleotidase domain-containing protein n=1 Tax=Peltaster fructicola TaxID=286661 RepID=A0A6H0XVS8_9PEZI|nr:hypothetical protein AMS68_004389 [Peltaster fructicola]
MHIIPVLSGAAKLAKVLISNDDGWAELNIRALYDALDTAGFSSVISAPAINKSGTGSLDTPARELGPSGCEFGSCPPYSPAVGLNSSMTRFNYVSSYPVTSVKYGIEVVAPTTFGGPPDIVVTGVNVGCNLDVAVLGSGTVGAACEAAKQGIPAIAFSGCTGSQISWEEKDPGYSTVYANLSSKIAEELVSYGKPYLPRNIWLNVNYGESSSSCSSSNDFKFVLSRILPAIPIITKEDLLICDNNGRLPTERMVVKTPGCFASISVGEASTKSTADAHTQAVVYNKLRSSGTQA